MRGITVCSPRTGPSGGARFPCWHTHALGIHTGTGGGSGGRNWGFSVGIFLDDWEGLAQSKMLDILGETNKMSTVKLGTPKYFKW